MNILISKEYTEIVLDGNVIELILHNDPKNFTVNNLYKYCSYFIQSFHNKSDINLTKKLLNDSLHLDTKDGQRYFLELSKLCYSMEF